MSRLTWKNLEASIRARIEVLENITQGALLLDLTGVVGDYQMTREQSLNSVIVLFNDDDEPAVENLILYNAPDNPDSYTIISCVSAGTSTSFIAGLMDLPSIMLQNGTVTKVIYGYTLAFEEKLTKLQTADHGDISVLNDSLTWKIKPAAILQETPENPTATASAEYVMMGLAAELTPIRSGNVMVIISGDVSSSVDDGACQLAICAGLGVAPSNGEAFAGTQQGAAPVLFIKQADERLPFTCNAVVTGLPLNTPAWIDLTLQTFNGGFSSLQNISISAVEL